jgi:uncharacterized membrane protein/uncharacterized protein with PQ loop repeat
VKLFGHPIHVMLIHFPAALFPMELVCYFIYFQTANASFGNAAFYAMFGGMLLGWLAVITGAIDLIQLKHNNYVQGKALIHGFVNSTVVISYTVFTYMIYRHYPNIPQATLTILLVKAALNVLLVVGNYLGGNLVLKYKVGVQNSKNDVVILVKHMQPFLLQIIGITAGILTSASFIPQLVKTVKTKEAEDVSLFMLLTRGVGLALWIIYGSIKGDIPVLLTFSFAFVINTAVIYFKAKYSAKNK